MPANKTIKVSVDKSHILTLGEKMYVEAIELVRELVNNAYDADATIVYVTMAADKIVIEDNGSGMNEKGLSQFFTIGSEEKRVRSVSPKFRRKRIGQFGIGKFAALAAADQFIVESKRGNWICCVTFDRADWIQKKEWELPIRREPATSLHHQGTKVTLTKLKKKFHLKDVERYLKESLPLRAKKFTVLLNQKPITPRYIPGRRFNVSFKTMYGPIEGEIVIAVNARSVDAPGIECRVKQVLIKRDFFGLDKQHSYGLNRLTGSVNTEFLPVTTSRNDFIQDSPEYQLFVKLMRAELDKIFKDLKKESDKKNLKKITKELRQALDSIRQALKLHPELTPSGRAIAARRKRKDMPVGSTVVDDPESTMSKSDESADKQPEEIKEENQSVKSKEQSKEQAPVMPKPQVIKKIRIKKLGISVGIVPLGPDGPEAYTQGNMVYINQDHPLYKKFSNKKELSSLHLMRLITQEIVLMKKIRLPAKEAYDMQSKLLTDAVISK